jgi:lauroyl/myristoyl acyltransferase
MECRQKGYTVVVEATPGMTTPEASRAPFPASTAASPPWVTANDLLWLLYLYPFRLVARLLPRWILYGIGRISNPMVQFHARRTKAKAAPWIAQACHTTPARARQIASQSLSNTMFRTLDALLLARPSSDKMLCCTAMDGFQNLESALARGKGVILLTGHFCANRNALRYLAAKGYRALSVHNRVPPNHAEGRFGRLFLKPRAVALQKSANSDQVYVEDPGCSLSILRRLRAGGLVCIQIDGREGPTVPEQLFLGLPWRIRSGIFELIRVSDCAVVPMLSLGHSSGFQIRFDPMLAIHPASSREAFVAANLPQFLTVVENQIVENPQEWRLWNHF